MVGWKSSVPFWSIIHALDRPAILTGRRNLLVMASIDMSSTRAPMYLPSACSTGVAKLTPHSYGFSKTSALTSEAAAAISIAGRSLSMAARGLERYISEPSLR